MTPASRLSAGNKSKTKQNSSRSSVGGVFFLRFPSFLCLFFLFFSFLFLLRGLFRDFCWFGCRLSCPSKQHLCVVVVVVVFFSVFFFLLGPCCVWWHGKVSAVSVSVQVRKILENVGSLRHFEERANHTGNPDRRGERIRWQNAHLPLPLFSSQVGKTRPKTTTTNQTNTACEGGAKRETKCE